VRNYQDNLCGLLQTILSTVGCHIEPEQETFIIQLIIRLFKLANRVTENGLIAFQGLCIGLERTVQFKEIGSYIKYALESKENDVARLACGIISDLSTNMG